MPFRRPPGVTPTVTGNGFISYAGSNSLPSKVVKDISPFTGQPRIAHIVLDNGQEKVIASTEDVA